MLPLIRAPVARPAVRACAGNNARSALSRGAPPQ